MLDAYFPTYYGLEEEEEGERERVRKSSNNASHDSMSITHLIDTSIYADILYIQCCAPCVGHANRIALAISIELNSDSPIRYTTETAYTRSHLSPTLA